MSKREMSKGKLVRKMTNSGTPIGPWCIIEMSNARNVQLRPLDLIEEPFIVFRTSVWIPKILNLCVSKEKIERIHKDGYGCITHPATKQWEKLFNEYDVALLYSMDGLKKLYCTIDRCEKYLSTSSCEYIISLKTEKVILCV